MESLNIVRTGVVARRAPMVNLGAVADAPPDEPAIGRWAGWLRLLILVGGSAGLWAGLGWIALRVMKLS